VTVHLKRSHIDRPPLGDIALTITTLITLNPDKDFIYHHKLKNKEYIFDTREVKTMLEDAPTNNPKVIKFIKEDIIKGIPKEKKYLIYNPVKKFLRRIKWRSQRKQKKIFSPKNLWRS